jgi:peptidyl-tRNA hydrolase
MKLKQIHLCLWSILKMEIKYKQYVIVPKKPKMSKGKIASQVAHATFMALNDWRCLNKNQVLKEWKKNGMCVIVLECKDELQLRNIDKYLEQWNITHHLYVDEGLYGCAPFTATALATGVLTEDQFWIFDNMRLLK